MALVSTTLANSLRDVFRNTNGQPVDIANQLANAYDRYARTAQAGALLPIFTGTEKTRLAQMLRPVMEAPAPSASLFANAWALGVLSYWLAPPVPFSGGILAGAPSAFVGQGILATSLTTILSIPNQVEPLAVQMATALDVATRTVLVTFSPPPGSVLPLA